MILFAVGRPIDPSPDEAESLLRHELLKPEYFNNNSLQRLLDWLQRILDGGISATDGLSPLTTFAAMFIGILLLGALVWLLSRLRNSARVSNVKEVESIDPAVTAAQLRARAETAVAEGRYAEALVEGFRALAARQSERGRLDNTPATTAQETARSLSGEYPQQEARVNGSATLFDSVLYGDRPATRDQAVDVLALDDELRSTR